MLIERMPGARLLNGEKDYEANRPWKNCFSPVLYRNRNAMERMFCRLKDFRRAATIYDRLAVNFLAAVWIVAIVSYRL